MLHKVHIRYHATTDDIMSAHIAAVGGTPHITDNGDGTYDLWSDDACSFIGIGADSYGYASYYYNSNLNVTKIEVFSGETLDVLYYEPGYGNIYATFSYFSAEEIVWHDKFGVTDLQSAFAGCLSLRKLVPNHFFMGASVVSCDSAFLSCGLKKISFIGCDFSQCTIFDAMFYDSMVESIFPIDFLHGASPTSMSHMYGYSNMRMACFDGVDFSSCYDMNFIFAGCADLVCVTNLDTTSSTDKSGMFDGCTSLVQPDATAQADLTDSDGANWVNPNPCQGVRAFLQKETIPHARHFMQKEALLETLSGVSQNESLFASLDTFFQKEAYPQLFGFVQKEAYPALSTFAQFEALMTTQTSIVQKEAMLSRARVFVQIEALEREKVLSVHHFRQREQIESNTPYPDTLIKIVPV